MMTKHWCKRCFKAVVECTASDRFLLMTNRDYVCPCCGNVGPVVAEFFKYGEQEVTSDGLHVVNVSRHVGVNPNYTFWGSCYPYEDVDNCRF